LEFVDLITDLQPQFLNDKLLRNTPEGGWTHPWKYFDSLRNYLLLTCFDLLGQPAAYKDFQSWLSSESFAKERAEAVALLSSDLNPVQIAAALHRGYLEVRGVHTSFVRFINKILPQEVRNALLFSVRIRRIDRERKVELAVIDTEKDKIEWMYSVRNSYTHRARNTGSPAAGIFRNWGKPVIIDGEPKMGWEAIDWLFQEKSYVEYSVRDWPRALQIAVKTGLAITDPKEKEA
jgi:hypothetical protein